MSDDEVTHEEADEAAQILCDDDTLTKAERIEQSEKLIAYVKQQERLDAERTCPRCKGKKRIRHDEAGGPGTAPCPDCCGDDVVRERDELVAKVRALELELAQWRESHERSGADGEVSEVG